jgi:hypothetical protein
MLLSYWHKSAFPEPEHRSIYFYASFIFTTGTFFFCFVSNFVKMLTKFMTEKLMSELCGNYSVNAFARICLPRTRNALKDLRLRQNRNEFQGEAIKPTSLWHRFLERGRGTNLQAGRPRVRVPMRSLDFFSHFPNPSSRTMALGSTQPLTEMSTRDLPGSKGLPARKANNLTTICEPIV